MKNTTARDFIIRKTAATAPLLAYSSEKTEEWRREAKAKLEELLGLPFERCDDAFAVEWREETDAWRRVRFTFQSEAGYTLEGDFFAPCGEKRARPVAICLQGHTSGRYISWGEKLLPRDQRSTEAGQDFVLQALRNDCCAVVIDQRYMGTAGENGEGIPGCCSQGHALPTLLLGRTPIGERVWDVMRLVDLLLSRFADEIDSERIFCMGNSGGGTATYYAACLDERIALAVPSCGVCSYEKSIMPIHHCSCNYVPSVRKYFRMGDIGCLLAPRALVLVCGVEDDIFPVDGVEDAYAIIEKAYADAGVPDRCRLVKGNGGHQFFPNDAWPHVRELLALR